uniref:hypothetical protein n=1 Tax=Bacteroides intestinalis TaxID=329854 RepID=UPI003FEEA8BC
STRGQNRLVLGGSLHWIFHTYFQIEIEGKNILEGAGIWYIQKKTEMIKIKFALDTRHGGTLSIHSDDITPDNERSKSIIIHQAL